MESNRPAPAAVLYVGMESKGKIMGVTKEKSRK
jgi:hypothetical protein